MWQTLRELLPLLLKGWWVWAMGCLAAVVGLMLDIFPNLTVPWWAWLVLAVIGLGGALVQAFHRVRVERDSFRPNPSSIGDWPVEKAVRYILHQSLWGVSRPSEQDAYDHVFPVLREAARNGFIVVWGREGRTIHTEFEPRVPIEQEYWKYFAFDELRCMPRDEREDETVITQTRRNRGQNQLDEVIYQDIFLVKAQVKTHWRKAYLWQRYRINLSNILVPRRPG